MITITTHMRTRKLYVLFNQTKIQHKICLIIPIVIMPAASIIHTGRLLSLTNAYQLAVTGSTAHRYSRIFGNFRLCHWALIHLAIIHGLYWSCLWTHYQHQDQIHLLRYFSVLLHDCVYAHLFVGVFTYAVVAFEYRKYVAFSGRLVAVANEHAAFAQRQREVESSGGDVASLLWWRRLLMGRSCSGLEWFVYYKMWMNTVVLLTLVVYNLCHIDLRQLTGTKVLLIIGLAYPHLLVANVLRYYTVHAMVVNALWQTDNDQLAAGVIRAGAPKPTTIQLDAFAGPSQYHQPQTPTASVQLGEQFVRFDRYQQLYADLNRLVQCQLGLLLKKNSLIVFIAVHVYVKVRLLWNAVLTEMDQHLMQVNLVTFVVMMLNDYVCLLVVSQVCQREVRRR